MVVGGESYEAVALPEARYSVGYPMVQILIIEVV